MTGLLIVVCIILLIVGFSYRRKIDEEEKRGLSTYSTANRLREHYGDLIDSLLKHNGFEIIMERSYDESIRLGIPKKQELFLCCSMLGKYAPSLHVAYIVQGVVLKEWRFDNRNTKSYIYNEIAFYIDK